jgi:hypothetical protein
MLNRIKRHRIGRSTIQRAFQRAPRRIVHRLVSCVMGMMAFAVLPVFQLGFASPFASPLASTIVDVGTDSAAKDLEKKASWGWSDAAGWVERFASWFEGLGKNDATVPVAALLDESRQMLGLRGIELHERLLGISSKADRSIAEFMRTLDASWIESTPKTLDGQLSSLIANGAIPAWLKPELQLAYARGLIHHQRIDEAFLVLQSLPIDSVSDPSSLLFSLAVCQHYLLMKQPCEESLRKLLERELEIPSRYAITARLMLTDIEPLKEDSLDEVARMMNDVERRLSLGRTGKQVREQEQAIIDKLDKMIEQMEKQQQQQQQQRKAQQQQRNQGQKQGQQRDSSQQQKAAEQSNPGGGDGEGEVDNKDIGDKSGWGNLPPAARQEALQSMTKDLPSHYREVIEAYFKRLSKGGEKP